MIDILSVTPHQVQTGVRGKAFLFHGSPSTRKTTVASSFPKALILATEMGYKMIPNVMAVPIKNWADFKQAVAQCKTDEVKERYETIVIDTVGLLSDMCVQYLCNINGIRELGELGYGKGWTQYRKEFRSTINELSREGYGIVLISHTDIKRADDGSITSAMPQLDKSPRETVIGLVDFILFLNKEEKDDNPEEITVYAYTKLHSNIETKTRARYLSPRFEFNFENLVKEINLAIEREATENGQVLIEESVSHQVEEREPFEELKQQILSKAQELMAIPRLEAKVIDLIANAMQGVRVSEANENYYDVFIALRAAMNEIH